MHPTPRFSRHETTRIACALALVSLSCQSGRYVRGTERPNTRVAHSAGHANQHVPSCRGESMAGVWAPPGFCVTQFADDLIWPRQLVFAPNGDLIVATREGLMVLWDDDHDGMAGQRERARIGGRDLSNQGIAFSPDGRWLYYAADQAVMRIPYQPGLRRFDNPGQIVIPDLPATISHPYKSITFDREGRLYVSVGSRDNLTPGEGARIMRYTIPAEIPALGFSYRSGEVFANGIRNAEALAWDHDGRLWAFVNGRDDLRPRGTVDTFPLDHPGDWIYRLSSTPGTFYGYPYCWALGTVAWGDRREPGSQWADPDANEGHDDAWCQSPANVFPAAGALPAHTAPLGAVMYDGTLFPEEYRGSLIVASHGSWNRHGGQIGRMLLRVQVDGDRVTNVAPFVGQRSSDGNLREGRWGERPVGVTVGPDGALYVASDEGGHVFRVGYGS